MAEHRGPDEATSAPRPPTVASLDAAMARALELADRGPVWGPNPRVGCVLLAPVTADGAPADGTRTVLAEGFHQGAGTPHAEAAALAAAREAGVDVRGATAVVTLEPCNHTGRTGPCAVALAEAGVAEVVYAVADPNPVASGGAEYLADNGVHVVRLPARGADALVHAWATSVAAGRPYVILKTATTLDGRVAARDGSSRWVTGPAARAHAHRVRAVVDAIAVGTGTVATDDPALTARDSDGALTPHQPLRVVVGHRDVPDDARLRAPVAGAGELVHLPTHDVAEVLAALHEREVRTLLVEGGPHLATAFLAAGAVDELHAYIAPALLGAGPGAVGDIGVATIADALRWRPYDVRRLDDDVLLVARAPLTPPAVLSPEEV